MIDILLSLDSYNSKQETLESELVLQIDHIDCIRDLMICLTKGYAVCPGLFDYEDGKEYVDNRFQKGVVKYSYFERRWKLLNHWIGGWCIFLDIDYCNITAEEFVSNLNLKPSIVYYTYSGNRDNPRFRIVYCFSEFLPRNKWKGAAVYLLGMAEANNPGVKIDPASVSGVQIMYGTTYDKLVWYQELYYTFQQLGCREIEVDNKPRRNIIWEIETGYYRGHEFVELITGSIRIITNDGQYRNIPAIDTRVIEKKFYNDMIWIYRTEQSSWLEWQLRDRVFSYQLIDKDNYLEVWPPNDRIQPGGRRKALLSYAEEVILIKNNVTPWELLYSLILYRKNYINYGYKTTETVKKKDSFGSGFVVTKDIIGINELIDIATTALSTPIEQILEHQQNWIERNAEKNVSKVFIVNKKAKKLENGRWKDYFPDKDELRFVRKAISDAIHNAKLKGKLEEFYQSNAVTTPIAVVAEGVGVHRSTLYNKITNPIQFERKPHRSHPLGITEDFWRQNYDSSLGVRANLRRLGISSMTYYRALERWGERGEDVGGGEVGG